ncbi:CLUMA_CG016379, isoform A [Clunio marinus]|uniref:CLUMA_CG016379, isoform A n=1 Tax=Clunio marinus TaxID=568069 RepID=A0A1J1ITJ7_9DIPT|nr:CLUMA_CG016379, isoform A [Clunio marinus]
MSANNVRLNSNDTSTWNCSSLESSKRTDVSIVAQKLSQRSTLTRKNCCDICGIASLLLFGFMFLTFGIITIKYTLFEIVLMERMGMAKIYPSYFWWKDPEPEVLMKVFIFNITNSEEFISGKDSKLKLQEIGPITFQEVLKHKDIIFHYENSTLSYTVTRSIVFKETENIKGILNQSVTVANMAALSGSSFVADNWLLSTSYKALQKLYGTRPIVNTTIYNYFFNLTDPILEFTKNIVPFLVPTKDTGILQNIYSNFTDRVNVQIGLKHGNENFFKINTWNHRRNVPGFYPENGDCNARIDGSTEAALWPQLCTKETIIWYWRKTLCRSVPLYFEEEIQMGSLNAFKYILRDDVYDRLENKTADCFRGSNLPDGLSDVSKCFFDQPIVASFPHFYSRPGKFLDKLDGLHPDPNKHRSFSIIEPILGVPLKQKASSQSNLVTKDLRGFKHDIAKFGDMVIPMFWIEYYLKEITPLIISTVDFIVNTLPKIQYWISAAFIILGSYLLLMGYLRLRNNEVDEGMKMKNEK